MKSGLGLEGGGGLILPTSQYYSCLPEPVTAATIGTTNVGSNWALGMEVTALLTGRIIALKYFREPGGAATARSIRLWKPDTTLHETVSFPFTSNLVPIVVPLVTPLTIQAGQNFIIALDANNGWGQGTGTVATFPSSAALDPVDGRADFVSSTNRPTVVNVGWFGIDCVYAVP